MSQSAPSLREQRIKDTSRALSIRARELTAECGLAGFTIEELCTHVGVSRRTFFNYFASKENAVMGIAVRTDLSVIDDTFLAASGDLLNDLADLVIARWDAAGFSAADVALVSAAVERAPELHRHFFENLAQDERTNINLVAMREGLDPSDDRATTAVHLMGALMRPSVAEYLAGDGDPTFRTIFLRRLAAARGLLNSTTKTLNGNA